MLSNSILSYPSELRTGHIGNANSQYWGPIKLCCFIGKLNSQIDVDWYFVGIAHIRKLQNQHLQCSVAYWKKEKNKTPSLLCCETKPYKSNTPLYIKKDSPLLYEIDSLDV